MEPLDRVTEQLWRPALASPHLRVTVKAREDSAWADAERYWLVPNEARARLLVPASSPAVTARSLTNYRNLRERKVNAARSILGIMARCRVPISRASVAVQVRRTAPAEATRLPLAILSAAFGQPLFASTGVRTGDNRKATLHLVDRAGRPVGYAKFGWNGPTDALVKNEGRALGLVDRGVDVATQAPRVLLELSYHGHPVVVTEPLPLHVRGGPNSVSEPTAEEMFCLTPVVRHDRVRSTKHFGDLTARLRLSTASPHAADLARASLTLAAMVETTDSTLPVSSLWHGDMTPWNRARDRDGRLWVWDWENSENDAVAGLDALHWFSSSHRMAQHGRPSVDLERCLRDAGAYLTAVGLRDSDRKIVAATYALTVVERACSLAAHARSWRDALIDPAGLNDLLRQGTALLRRRQN